MSTAKKNKEHNRKFQIKGLIYSQHTPTISAMRFGVKPMSYNGCGLIAVYNALILLKQPDTLQNIADYYEKRGRWIMGLWGIRPDRITGFLKAKGFLVESCNYLEAKSGVYIMLVWNKKGGGLHYMAARKFPSGMVEIYNGYIKRNSCDTYTGFNEFFDTTLVTGIKLWRIYKNE